MKRAATVLILENGKVLAVSRKDNPNDFGLPGGRCEEGESFVSCAKRELLEETGLQAYDLMFVFSRMDNEFVVETFIPKTYHGIISTTEEGKVKWVDMKVIENGSFGEYNKSLFKHLKLR